MDILAQLKQAFEDFKIARASADQKVNELIKNQEAGINQNTSDLKVAIAKADEMAQKVADFSARILEVEQKLVKGIVAGKEQPKSFGQIIVEDQSFRTFAAGQSQKCRIVLKNGFSVRANTITGQEGSPAENTDTLVPADRRPGIIGGAFQPLKVKDLIPKGNTVSNAVEFTRELTFTNAASGVKEGAAKPESALTFELYSAPVVTIATFLKVSKQIRDDAPALIAYIENRLRYAIDYEEELQIVSGAGSGDLIGMLVSPNYTAFTPTSGETAIDSVNRAIRALDAAAYPATGVIMHPTTWGSIERLKDSNENYLVGSPFGVIVPTIWGKPVAVTPSMTASKLLTAAFNMAFMYLSRQETIVEMFEQDDDNVQKNLITIRAEKRSVLGGLRPASVLYGALTV